MELREFVKGDLWSKSWLYRVQMRMSIVTLEIRWSRWRRDALAAGPYRPLGIDSRQLTAMCSDHRPRIDPMSARPGRVRLHPSGEVVHQLSAGWKTSRKQDDLYGAWPTLKAPPK